MQSLLVDKRKILVVDDSQPIAAIIEAALKKEGYDVCVGQDGVEGLKMALVEKPDLIICDSVMPRMDGFALIRALQGKSCDRADTDDSPYIESKRRG